jgi:hypothetical protein
MHWSTSPRLTLRPYWNRTIVSLFLTMKMERGEDVPVVGQNPPTGVDRQHESREARSLYLLALQLTRALRLRFVGHAA